MTDGYDIIDPIGGIKPLTQNKRKFSFDIITDENGKVRLENLRHKRVPHKLADALNKGIEAAIKDYNFEQKIRPRNRFWTTREETRRLIKLGLNPKTRDYTFIPSKGRRGAYYIMEGYRTMDEIQMFTGRRPKIERRWSRTLLDRMLMKPDEVRHRWYFEREVEKSVSEIEARIKEGTFNKEYLKGNYHK